MDQCYLCSQGILYYGLKCQKLVRYPKRQTQFHQDQTQHYWQGINTYQKFSNAYAPSRRGPAQYGTHYHSKIPVSNIIYMVVTSSMWINIFPTTDGVSTIISPRMLVTGVHVNYNNNCRIKF